MIGPQKNTRTPTQGHKSRPATPLGKYGVKVYDRGYLLNQAKETLRILDEICANRQGLRPGTVDMQAIESVGIQRA